MNIYLFNEFSEITETKLEQAISRLPDWRRYGNDKIKTRQGKIFNAYALHLLEFCLKTERYEIDLYKTAPDFNEKGKPFFSEADFDFSLSHSSHGIICAVKNGKNSIGIDIEHIRPFNEKVALRVCCEEEINLLQTAAEIEKSELFCSMWVQKEAFSKMTGNGYAEGFKKINTLKNNTLALKSTDNDIDKNQNGLFFIGISIANEKCETPDVIKVSLDELII